MYISDSDQNLALLKKDPRFQFDKELPVTQQNGKQYRVLTFAKKLSGWEIFGRYLAWIFSAITIIPLICCRAKLNSMLQEAKNKKISKNVYIPLDPKDFIDVFDRVINQNGFFQSKNNDTVRLLLGESLQGNTKNLRLEALSRFLLIPVGVLEQKMRGPKDGLEAYLQKKISRYRSVLTQARIDYHQIITQNPNITTERRRELMKVVRVGNRALTEKACSNQGALVQAKNGHFIVKRDGRDLKVIRWTGIVEVSPNAQEHVGSGTFGVVQRVYDCVHGTCALKLAKHSLSAKEVGRARRCVVNEAKKLYEIHESGIKIGLQLPPIAVFEMREGNPDQMVIGYAQRLCNMGSLLKNLETLTRLERLQVSLQLLQGLQTLQNPDNPIVHGDIKLENILLHREDDGTVKAYLADLGDAKYLNSELRLERRKDSHPVSTVHTRKYLTLGDSQRLSQANTEEEWKRAQQKRDLYALARTLWMLLSKHRPYERYRNDRYHTPITAGGVRYYGEVSQPYGRSLADILVRALSDNPDSRPSIQAIINNVNTSIGRYR